MNTKNIPSLSTASFFRQLIMNEVIHDRYWDSKTNRVKYILRTLITPKATFKLLSFLAATPNAKTLIERQPSLPYKVHRPYLRAGMNTKDKLKSICAGSCLIFNSLKKSDLEKIYSKDGLCIDKIDGKTDNYTIALGMENKFSREGELVVHFKTSGKIILASCAFGFLFTENNTSLFIGAIQGGGKQCTPELIKEATKSCYGLFPKRILIEVVCLLAQRFGCNEILAVSNNTHVFQNSRYKRKKNSLMISDYDGFWESLSGHKNAKQDYILPLSIKRKDIADVSSKKRSEYKKRYVLLDNLTANFLCTC